MSYCRFSDDNWRSDVYAYESADGFELHIASVRRVGDIPELPSILDVSTEEFMQAYQAHMTAVSTAERVPINGPHDGKSFTFGTVQELFYCLSQLQADGYHVPDFVFEAIEEEMNEEPTE